MRERPKIRIHQEFAWDSKQLQLLPAFSGDLSRFLILRSPRTKLFPRLVIRRRLASQLAPLVKYLVHRNLVGASVRPNRLPSRDLPLPGTLPSTTPRKCDSLIRLNFGCLRRSRYGYSTNIFVLNPIGVADFSALGIRSSLPSFPKSFPFSETLPPWGQILAPRVHPSAGLLFVPKLLGNPSPSLASARRQHRLFSFPTPITLTKSCAANSYLFSETRKGRQTKRCDGELGKDCAVQILTAAWRLSSWAAAPKMKRIRSSRAIAAPRLRNPTNGPWRPKSNLPAGAIPKLEAANRSRRPPSK